MGATSVKAPRLTLLVLVYVTLDLSSPFVPGAFNFDPDDSVEGVQSHREADARPAAVSEVTPRATPSDRDPLTRPDARGRARPRSATVADWLVDVRRAHAPVSGVSTLSEDH